MIKKINILNPPLDLFIGYTGESNYRTFEIDATGWKTEYPNGIISILFKRVDQEYAYPVIVNNIGNTVFWTVSSTEVNIAGFGSLVIRIISNDVIGKTCTIKTITKSSPDFTNIVPELYPDWTTDVLEAGILVQQNTEEVIAAKDTAVGAKDTAVSAQTSAETSAGTATEKAAEAVLDAQSALDSKTAAAQALSDLLALIGTDVCNLVNGQIPVDKIPLSVVYDIVEITDESELISLTAEQVQKKDIAAIIEGTGDAKRCIKSYQLLGDGSPSIRSNWVEVAVTYASTAAFAATSGEAENANTVNGHRIVKFDTYADMISAVKVDDTIYYAPLS